jgi:hypothetical protein
MNLISQCASNRHLFIGAYAKHLSSICERGQNVRAKNSGPGIRPFRCAIQFVQHFSFGLIFWTHNWRHVHEFDAWVAHALNCQIYEFNDGFKTSSDASINVTIVVRRSSNKFANDNSQVPSLIGNYFALSGQLFGLYLGVFNSFLSLYYFVLESVKVLLIICLTWKLGPTLIIEEY